MTLRKPSKYGARRVTLDGVTFDSAGEANRWRQLQLLAKAGVVKGLGEPHPSFPIMLNGTKVCTVEMDFAYSENGQAVVEDWKGFDNQYSRLKRKLLAAAYPHLVIKITGPAGARQSLKRAVKAGAKARKAP